MKQVTGAVASSKRTSRMHAIFYYGAFQMMPANLLMIQSQLLQTMLICFCEAECVRACVCFPFVRMCQCVLFVGSFRRCRSSAFRRKTPSAHLCWCGSLFLLLPPSASSLLCGSFVLNFPLCVWLLCCEGSGDDKES